MNLVGNVTHIFVYFIIQLNHDIFVSIVILVLIKDAIWTNLHIKSKEVNVSTVAIETICVTLYKF